jgi:transcriptional regulator with XRE-family HTH domain
MIREEYLSKKRGWSGMELARRSGLSPSTISQMRHRRFIPYPSQLAKLVAALEYEGNGAELLEEVVEDGTTAG